jgi:hypothetical protein
MEVAGDGAHIEVRWTATMDLDDIVAFVITRGLAISLAYRRVPLLHACAITAGAGAFLFVGPSGSGKSTIAAAAVAQGAALMADDIAALTLRAGQVYVEPGLRRMRLDGDTAQALGWNHTALTRVFADPRLSDKRSVELSGGQGRFCGEPQPLRGIHVLGTRLTGEPETTRLSPVEALARILDNLYGDDLLDPMPGRPSCRYGPGLPRMYR